MAKWLPGQSGNPGGRPRMPEELRLVRAVSSEEVRLTISKYLRMTRDEIQAAAESPSTPALELMIASGIAYGIKSGDYSRLMFLLERTIGKVPQEPLLVGASEDYERLKDEVPIETVIEYLKEKRA